MPRTWSPETDAERVRSSVDASGGADSCWPWTGISDPDGYGVTRMNRRKYRAHRATWELANGPIPAGMLVCHRCDNPSCCNPAHLFLGAHNDNMVDRDTKGRQPQGERHYLRRDPARACRGERHPRAKLSDADARELLSRLTGRYGEQTELAAEYGVSVSLVRKMARGGRKAWLAA